MNIEIIETELSTIPKRYSSIIIEEINRVLSLPCHNKGMDIRVIGLKLKYSNINGVLYDHEKADTISIKVLFDRLDKPKGIYALRSSGHLGIHIYLPKKIKKKRDNLISDILNKFES